MKVRESEFVTIVGASESCKSTLLNINKRVAIARSLIKHPRLLLADEPTGVLDSKTSSQLLDLLFALNKQGLTIILVTHNKEIAQRIDNIYEIIDGNMKKVSDNDHNKKII